MTVSCSVNFNSNKITFEYDGNKFEVTDIMSKIHESHFLRFGVYSSSTDNRVQIVNVRNNLTLLDIDQPITNMRKSSSKGRYFKDTQVAELDNQD